MNIKIFRKFRDILKYSYLFWLSREFPCYFLETLPSSMKIHSISLQGLRQQVSKMADASNIDVPEYSSSSFTPSEKLELSVSKLVYI